MNFEEITRGIYPLKRELIILALNQGGDGNFEEMTRDGVHKKRNHWAPLFVMRGEGNYFFQSLVMSSRVLPLVSGTRRQTKTAAITQMMP